MAALVTLSVVLVLGVLAACEPGPTGLAAEACGALPYFTEAPVALDDLDYTSVVGGLGAPGHTLPTAHVGLFVRRNGVPVVAPGRIQVNSVRRVTYVSSPTREGERDYAVFFSACADVEGWFGHLTSLSPAIPDNAAGSGCETYSTSVETVESCTVDGLDVVLAAGASMGTAGLSVERGFAALDFGLLDARVRNAYVSPSRHPEPTLHAVCPYDYFDGGTREALLSALRDASKPDVVPAGEPRCGTMEVDVAGTAKGVWAEEGVTGSVQGDERPYITLADYPYQPQERLALSLGPITLGARVAVVPRASGTRVNRAFEDVTPDGRIYCYNTADATDFGFGSSWLLELTSPATLEIERVDHPGSDGPCVEDPSVWSFSAPVTMVR